MARKEEDRHLIDHFFRRERLTRHGVTRCHDLRGQIIRRGACGNLISACLAQPRDQPSDHRRRPPGRRFVKPGHPAWQGQKGRKVQKRLRALIGAKLTKHRRGDLVFDGNGKQRAKDHIGRRVAHVLFNFGHAGRHARRACRPGRHHRRKGVAQSAPLKSRIDDPALALPNLTIGDKNRIAQKRAQPLADAVGLREILRPF